MFIVLPNSQGEERQRRDDDLPHDQHWLDSSWKFPFSAKLALDDADIASRASNLSGDNPVAGRGIGLKFIQDHLALFAEWPVYPFVLILAPNPPLTFLAHKPAVECIAELVQNAINIGVLIGAESIRRQLVAFAAMGLCHAYSVPLTALRSLSNIDVLRLIRLRISGFGLGLPTDALTAASKSLLTSSPSFRTLTNS